MRAACILAALFLALATPCLPAAEPAVPIKEIAFSGLKNLGLDRAQKLLKIKVGETYAAEKIEKEAKRLATEYRFFEECKASATPVAGGMRVVFAVVERPLIQGIVFRGNHEFDIVKLEQKISVQKGQVLDVPEAAASAKALRKFYISEGYSSAKVDYKIEDNEGGSRVIFQIDEGKKITVLSVKFVGVKAFKVGDLMAAIKTRPKYLVFFGGVLDDEEMAEDVNRLTDFYKDAGYLDAKVDRKVAVHDSKAAVTFSLSEGDRYKVGVLSIKGNHVFNEAKLRSAFLLQPGAFFSRRALEQDVKSMLAMYGDTGYVEARVLRKPSFDFAAKKVDVAYEIEEGDLLQLEEIDIVMQEPALPENLADNAVQTKKGYRQSGMATTPETFRKVLGLPPGTDIKVEVKKEDNQRRLQIRMAKGGKFSKSEADLMIKKLYDRGWFKEARPPDIERGSTPQSRRLVLRVEEEKTGGLTVAAGISSDTGGFGEILFEQENFDISDFPQSFGDIVTGNAFKGGGQDFWIDARPGLQESSYTVGFKEPWFGEKVFYDQLGWRDPVSMTTTARYFTRDQHFYDETRAGGTVDFGRDTHWSALWNPRLDLSMRAEQVRISDFRHHSRAALKDEKGTTFVAGPRLGLSWDTTDDKIFPTRGVKAQTWAEVVGGDKTYATGMARASLYRTLFDLGGKHVLNLRGTTGVTGPDTPIFDRFFAGGTDTVRGFEYRGMGRRATNPVTGNKKDGVPLGGEALAVGNVEYGFPIYKLKDAFELRGVTFIDTGLAEKTFSLSELRASIGAGLRVRIGALGSVPIAVDFAVPLREKSGDETQLVSFFVGARY